MLHIPKFSNAIYLLSFKEDKDTVGSPSYIREVNRDIFDYYCLLLSVNRKIAFFAEEIKIILRPFLSKVEGENNNYAITDHFS